MPTRGPRAFALAAGLAALFCGRLEAQFRPSPTPTRRPTPPPAPTATPVRPTPPPTLPPPTATPRAGTTPTCPPTPPALQQVFVFLPGIPVTRPNPGEPLRLTDGREFLVTVRLASGEITCRVVRVE